MTFPRRSSRLAAMGKGAPTPSHVIPDMYITQLSFASRWRDKDYGDASVTNWYFDMCATTNKTSPPDYMYGTPKNSPRHSFWYNCVYITDTHIRFGYHKSSLAITTIDGLVQLSKYDPYFTNTYTNCPFHPSITYKQICKKLKKHLVHISGSEYGFNYQVPEGMYPDDYNPPVFTIKF